MVGKLLYLILGNRAGIVHHVIMRGSTGAFSHVLGTKEEVKVLRNHLITHQGTAGGVPDDIRATAHKEAVVDSLGDDNLKEFRLVVGLHLLEAGQDVLDLDRAHLVELALADTVSVEDNRLGEIVVELLVLRDGLLHQNGDVLHNLLTLLRLGLNSAVIAGEVLVDRRAEPDDAELAGLDVMIDVGTDDHQSFGYLGADLDGPESVAHLREHLKQELLADGRHVLAVEVLDEHDLGRQRLLLNE